MSDQQNKKSNKAANGTTTGSTGKKKDRRGASGVDDMKVIPDYNSKLNMLDPDSKMSKLVGVILIIGIILYFCDIVIAGLAMVLLAMILYAALRISLKRKKKKEQEAEETAGKGVNL